MVKLHAAKLSFSIDWLRETALGKGRYRAKGVDLHLTRVCEVEIWCVTITIWSTAQWVLLLLSRHAVLRAIHSKPLFEWAL